MQLKKAAKGARTHNVLSSGAVTGSLTSSGISLGTNNKKLGLPVLAPVIDLKSTSKSAAGTSATTADPFANRKGTKRDKSVRVFK